MISTPTIASALANPNDIDQDEYSPDRHAIAGDLRDALDKNSLYLQYQPQVNCLTGRTRRVEALARWNHAKRGIVPPADFIPLAERTGLIEPLTVWIMEQALRNCVLWNSAGKEIAISVNLSAQSLADTQLADKIDRVVRSVGARHTWLDIEVTEGAVSAIVENLSRRSDHLRSRPTYASNSPVGTGDVEGFLFLRLQCSDRDARRHGHPTW